MRKQLVLILIAVGLLAAGSIEAQGDPFVIWHALAPEDDDVVLALGQAFGREAGLTVEVVYKRPQTLFGEAAAALTSRAGPDVIIAGNDQIDLLLDSDAILPDAPRRAFFLRDLLVNLPMLLESRCEDTAIQVCLWPRVSPLLPVPFPENDAIEFTGTWLCDAAPWMPFCDGGALPGAALSWWYNVYLINLDWMAQNGLDVPYDAEGVAAMRSEYGLDYLWAEPGKIPLAAEADFPPVYAVRSQLIVEDPNGVMRSMGSFFEAGYQPVLEIGVNSAYAAADTDQARAFLAFVAEDTGAKVGLMDSSQWLPAFSADQVRAQDSESEAALTTLRALMTLVSYASLAY